MKVLRRNAFRGIALALLISCLLFIVLVEYAPDSVPFSPNNYGWNGIQGIASAFNVNFTTMLSSLPANSVLVVAQPSVSYSVSDAASVNSFLAAGGTVLVADKSGVANSLLRGIGSAIRVENGSMISDPTYNWKARSVPTALVLPGVESRYGFLVNVTGIALNGPAPLSIANSAGTGLAITSQFSSASLASGGSANSEGPYTVMAAQKIGSGTLIVVGDPQFLLNSEWTIANNKVLIGNLFENKSIFIDASHWESNPLASSTAQMKAEIRQAYAALSGSPMRYVVTILFVLAAILLVPAFAESTSGGATRGSKGVAGQVVSQSFYSAPKGSS